jgi:hypothetical protein
MIAYKCELRFLFRDVITKYDNGWWNGNVDRSVLWSVTDRLWFSAIYNYIG